MNSSSRDLQPRPGSAFRRIAAAGLAVAAVGASAVLSASSASAITSGTWVAVYQVGPTKLQQVGSDRIWTVGHDAFDVRASADAPAVDFTVLDEDQEQLCGPTTHTPREPDSCTVPALPLGLQTIIAAAKDADGKIIGTRDLSVYVIDKPNPEKPGGGEGGTTPEPVVAEPEPGEVDNGFSPFPTPEPVVTEPEPGEVDNGFSPFPTPEPVVAEPDPGESDGGFSPFPTPAEPLSVESLSENNGWLKVTFLAPGRANSLVEVRKDGQVKANGFVGLDERVTFSLWGGAPGSRVSFDLAIDCGGKVEKQSIELQVPGETAVAEPEPGQVDDGFTPFPTPEPVVAKPNPGETDPGFTVQPGDGGEEQDVPGKGTLQADLVNVTAEFAGVARVHLVDPAAAKAYDVQIWLDGQQKEIGRVAPQGGETDDTFLRGFGAGHHTIEIRSNGVVIDTLEFDV